MSTVAQKLEECAASMSGTFTRQEILSWFRRHYPDVPESTIGAHIQAMTSNASNRERNSPGLGSKPPLFDRLGHGLYRVHVDEVGPERQVTPPTASPKLERRTLGLSEAKDEWGWEGNVQARVVAFLARQGVAITRVADTSSREHGTDIEGVLDNVRVHVEVKGWPSVRYVDPSRSGEQKKTQPLVMARSWFADGVMQALRLRHEHPFDSVALALPRTGTYERLFDSLRTPLESVHVSVLWVAEDGSVALDGWGRQPDSGST